MGVSLLVLAGGLDRAAARRDAGARDGVGDRDGARRRTGDGAFLHRVAARLRTPPPGTDSRHGAGAYRGRLGAGPVVAGLVRRVDRQLRGDVPSAGRRSSSSSRWPPFWRRCRRQRAAEDGRVVATMRALMLGDDLAGAGGLCRRRGRQDPAVRRRASRRAGRGPVWCAGLVACVAHILIAMAYRHGWSHEAAVLETARQTAAVYGLAWGGGVYVNYLFVGVWLAEIAWWRSILVALRGSAAVAARVGAGLLLRDRVQRRGDLRDAGSPAGRHCGDGGAGGGVGGWAPAGIELTC